LIKILILTGVLHYTLKTAFLLMASCLWLPVCQTEFALSQIWDLFPWH